MNLLLDFWEIYHITLKYNYFILKQIKLKEFKEYFIIFQFILSIELKIHYH